MMSRPVLVHIAPLPPVRTGIADYAASILLQLAPHYECLCVVADPALVDARIRAVAAVLSYRDYDRVAPALEAERHLLHLGNNPEHIPVLDLLGRVRPVTVLHDLSLHYLLELWTRAGPTHRSRMAEVARLLHGGAAAHLVNAKFERRLPVQAVYGEVTGLPMLEGAASAVILHSRAGEVTLRANGFTGPTAVIPHFAELPDPAVTVTRRIAWRRRLGLSESTTLFASLGFVTPSKQIPLVLRALAALPPGIGDWHYLVAGEARDPAVPAAVMSLGLVGRVTFLDYLAEESFEGLLSAADVLVNLRTPISGSASGPVCRALAHGLPCLVSAHGWYAELPQEATWQVEIGEGMEARLRATLALAVLDPDQRAAKGAAAAHYAREALSLNRVADAFRQVIEAVHPAPSRPPPPKSLFLLHQPCQPVQLSARSDANALLAALLRAERVNVAGQPAAPILLGDERLARLVPELEAPPRADAALRQAFAVLDAQEGVGSICNLALDAWRRLRLGEVLTVAVICLQPEEAFGGRLAEVMEEAGFVPVRSDEQVVVPDSIDTAYARVAIGSWLKASLAEPSLAVFRPVNV